MFRKLFLSTIAAFWSKKSSTCIATVLMCSVFFHGLHTHYRPYKLPSCNVLQHTCLTVLSLLYFCGLLIKVTVNVTV
jgi:hypothetical protein